MIPKKVKDFSGQRFGRRVVTAYVQQHPKNGESVWRWVCDCGAQNSQVFEQDAGNDDEAYPADADEPMTVGLDCCPHQVPYGSDCDECDEEEADTAIGLTPNA